MILRCLHMHIFPTSAHIRELYVGYLGYSRRNAATNLLSVPVVVGQQFRSGLVCHGARQLRPLEPWLPVVPEFWGRLSLPSTSPVSAPNRLIELHGECDGANQGMPNNLHLPYKLKSQLALPKPGLKAISTKARCTLSATVQDTSQEILYHNP